MLIRLALTAVILSILSSCIPGKVIDVVPGSGDCRTGCEAAAAGWPLPYIVDGHNQSPHGSADLFWLVLVIDRLDGAQAVLNWLLWLIVVAAIFAGWKLGR